MFRYGDIEDGRPFGQVRAKTRSVAHGNGPYDALSALQTTAGNAAVSRIMGRKRPIHPPISTRASIQRCGGGTSCCCRDEVVEQSYSAKSEEIAAIQALDSDDSEAPSWGAGGPTAELLFTQRSVSSLTTYGSKSKTRLEHPDLASSPRLQEAVSSANKALNVGQDSGEGVLALQSALRKLQYKTSDGSAVPLNGSYDVATQSAVAALQRDSGIPYPSGRQAGPKTLSALDDRLLKGQPKPDDPFCTTYRKGEREDAASSPGEAKDSGQELRIYNFAVGSPHAKAEKHERAIKEFISKNHLFDPEHSEWRIVEIVGYSDAVDNEEKNADLRAMRAADVRFLLNRTGVPDSTMVGVDRAASLMEYERGCTPASRSWDRSVIIRLQWKRPKPHPVPKPIPDKDPDWQPSGLCKTKPSRQWSINGSAGASKGADVVAGYHGTFTLTDRESGKWRILSFTGFGGSAGYSFPFSVGIDSAEPFETVNPMYFENFEGQGAIGVAEAMIVVGYAIGRLKLPPNTRPEFIPASGFQFGWGGDVTLLGGKWWFDPVLGMTCHG